MVYRLILTSDDEVLQVGARSQVGRHPSILLLLLLLLLNVLLLLLQRVGRRGWTKRARHGGSCIIGGGHHARCRRLLGQMHRRLTAHVSMSRQLHLLRCRHDVRSWASSAIVPTDGLRQRLRSATVHAVATRRHQVPSCPCKGKTIIS